MATDQHIQEMLEMMKKQMEQLTILHTENDKLRRTNSEGPLPLTMRLTMALTTANNNIQKQRSQTAQQSTPTPTNENGNCLRIAEADINSSPALLTTILSVWS